MKATPAPGKAEQRRASKWRAMDFLRRESVRKRQRSCQVKPTGKHVSARASEVHGFGYAGLQSCGSITCPHCGPKIAKSRRDELVQAVSVARAAGMTIYFGTLTIRHHKGQSADAVMDAVSAGWRGVTGDRRWKNERETWGIAGFVRAFETKYSTRNGWHTHCHFLLFVEPSETPELDLAVFGEDWHKQLFAGIFDRWAAAVVDEGFSAPLPVAQDFHEVVDDEQHRTAEYLAKMANEEPAITGDTRIAWEMASHGTKTAHNYASGFELRTILELAAEGDERALNVWNEYELAMTGRRTIAWSRGLRALLGLGVEKSDEELAAEEPGDENLVTLTSRSWSRAVKRRGFRWALLEYLAKHGPEETVVWLHRQGLVAWTGDPPAEG